MRVLFALCALLMVWSLLAWWGTAFGPNDHYKFGALGAAKVNKNGVQERCSWYLSGPYDAHCQPADARRLMLLRLGAPALLACLAAAAFGAFAPRRVLAVVIVEASAVAIAAIAFNADAALAFSAGRAVGMWGLGFNAALLTMLLGGAATAAMRQRQFP